MTFWQSSRDWKSPLDNSSRPINTSAVYCYPIATTDSSKPPENKPWNYWLGAEEVGLSAAEVAAAWEMTMNLNDVPLALNFIIFLSRVNWIGVFSGMICCSSGFGCRMV